MIRIRGLHKAFGELHAVRGADLDVEQGHLLVVLGQNGAGKSTTLRCAGGVLKPDSGDIQFGDLRLPRDVDRVRSRLGVVPDQARLYGRNTAREYLDHFGFLYGVEPAERARRIGGLLERFDLAGRDSQPLATYSRGMAQKVALIRATLHQPDWIFCDEPTSGLDPVAAAEMRAYLEEQRARGAALVVTTHILPEAELMADRLAIMRSGLVVAHGTLADLRRTVAGGRRYRAVLSGDGSVPVAIELLAADGLAPELQGAELTFSVPWAWDDTRIASLAAALQARLDAAGRPFHRLEEAPVTLEAIYRRAMAEPDAGEAPQEPAAPASEGIRIPRLVESLREQPGRLRHLLPFYVSAWWRRGELGWVMSLNAFVLLLVASASLFGSIPGGSAIASRLGTGTLGAGLLLPLFFMSFALLESIKTSIGIWWEKAQGSLEVLLFAPVGDPELVWMEVLPGAAVSGAWITIWMAAGLGLLAAFGRPAPWDLLPVFAFVAVATAYWAAMGRMLGFLLFPREGAAGGAWSFLLSPVSAAVADLPLALFVFRSPLAPASLLLPLTACVALTILTGASFDRERLLDAGVSRERPRRRGTAVAAVLNRHWRGLAAATALAAGLAVVGAAVSLAAGAHSWPSLRAALSGASLAAAAPVAGGTAHHLSGAVNVAAAALAGISAALALALVMLAVTFAAFFLLGVPELLALIAAAGLWGAQAGFGPDAPLAGWLAGAGGVALATLVLNTAGALPVYGALVFGAGRRVDRLRAAWTDYFAVYRLLVLPACAVFGAVVTLLLVLG